ncbi:hypothetical protein MPTA5024_23895 [Microbispora sp. ATCC PTA-5024]|nr:hypothetical protein MPTA5024_23895 [Microbispora sp. ATCC PTA-5024]
MHGRRAAHRPPRPRLAVAGVAVVLLSGGAGCAVVPTSSSPRAAEENSGRDTLIQPYVRMIATPPRENALPEEIVKGFQAAMASFDDSRLPIARTYLTPSTASRWNPLKETEVYEGKLEPDRSAYPKNATSVTIPLKGRLVATIDPQGRYHAVSGPLDQAFTLVKVQGQWRIDAPPDVRFLSSDDVKRAYRPVDLCYPSATPSPGLVVDRVWVPIEPSRGVPETRVRRLLDGPTDAVRDAVTTAFPSGTDLNQITVEGDTVVVDFTAAIESVQSDRIEAMKAQLAWTLGELAAGRNIEIRVNGEPFRDKGLRFRPGDYARFDPNVLTSSAQIYYMRDGKLQQAQEKEKSGGVPVAGAAGEQDVKFTDPAVSSDYTPRVAAIVNGDGVYVTAMSKGSPWRRVITGKKLTAPSWDRYGQVWTAEPYGLQQTRVWQSDGGPARKVLIPEELATSHVSALRVSRDGARVAVITDEGLGTTVKVGTIVRIGGQAKIDDMQTLVDARDEQKIVNIAWQDAADLLVLSEGKSGQELTTWSVMEGKIDPDAPSKPDTNAKIDSLSAAPGHVLAGEEDGTVLNYSIDKKDWNPVAKDGARTPVYPLG